MNQNVLIPESQNGERSLYIVEAPQGQERRNLLAAWLERERKAGSATYLLCCDFAFGGPWAGLADLLQEIVAEAERAAPALVQHHAGELTMVIPNLRSRLRVLNPTLTDSAAPAEKVRNYPMDRAYRIVHGLVNFLNAWSTHRQVRSWVIACDQLEDAGALVKMFFRELMRRRGQELGLTLICAVRPGNAEQVRGADGVEPVYLHWDLPEHPELRPDPERMAELAREMEERYGDDFYGMSENIPKVIYYWQHGNSPERALFWTSYAFGRYNHFGLYEDALRYGNEVLSNLDSILNTTNVFSRWNLVGPLANCHLALNQPEKALDIVEREGLAKVDVPDDLSRIFYVLALIHSRFLPKPDFAKAEEYIARGLLVLKDADVPTYEKVFLEVFLNNGLAFIRHRQGRPQEAIELCQEGFEMLEKHLEPDQHRLHRSVLLYNIAQVYAALRELDKAVEYYSAAMEYDPNYSEYFNERGNTYLGLGRCIEAVADYHQAIELSGPFQEVWTNLGQAYKRLGRFHEAVHAYSQALDLEPHQILPRLGRAQAYDALSLQREALADYSMALELDPAQPLALANRAGLWYDLGRLDRAVEDLDRAVHLDPENPDLLYNRSVALADLGRHAEAARDLQAFLAVRPETDEQAEIKAKIDWLTSAADDRQPLQPAAAPA